MTLDDATGVAAAPVIWMETAGPDDVPAPGRGRIVVVHGSLDRSAGMLKLSRQLDGEFQVTRYDRRGYGRSVPCAGPFGIDAQVADLRSVIARATGRSGHGPVEPVVLFGHSYGGNVVLTLADRYPELVRAVAVYESPMPWEDWWPPDSGTAIVATQPGAGEAAEAFLRYLIGDARWERLPESTRRARRAEGPAMVGELLDLRRGRPWRPERIGVPVLTMYGEQARPHHQRAMGLVAEWVPDGDVRVVSGAHHFGPNTHPAVVARYVTDFLAAHGIA